MQQQSKNIWLDSSPEALLLTEAYFYFNQKNINKTLQTMHPEVEWANAMEGGNVHGHNEVRDYWTRQWKLFDPHVEPVNFEQVANGKITVTVHQIIKDITGNLLIDQMVHHIYTIENGLIKKMEMQSL